ncbi:MAG: diguanylate cyclase [Pyrinomonadaceae bacterium]
MEKRVQAENVSWEIMQDDLAEKHGLAIILTDADTPEILKSNNNSMCRHLYASEEFAPECAKYCGRAFEWAIEAGGKVEYKCYAGLSCVAVPVTERAAAIVGRAFLKSEDYRNATGRAIAGDWQKFQPDEFFENVLLSGSSKNLEAAANRLEHLRGDENAALERFLEKNKSAEGDEFTETDEIATIVEQFHRSTAQNTINRRSSKEAEEIAAWRSLFGSLLNLSYEKAYQSILRFAAKRYSVKDLAWLERRGKRLETAFTEGRFKTRQIQISIAADDTHLLEAVRRESSLELRERQSVEENAEPQKIRLFPVAVGREVWNALIVGDHIEDEETKRQIVRFCHHVAPELEILRLREQLARRGWLDRAVQRFNDNLENIDADDFWTRLVQISAELLKAERSSLLLFDEKSNAFVVKAATGARADIIKRETVGVGERVAGTVLHDGKPVVVADVNKAAFRVASPEFNYKTDSFISYPIAVGGRKIGVLNVTDRADGGVYGEEDLELLDAIAPQLGVLIDRLTLKNKAGEFEQLSVTDALTGLLNRRYLEERLSEEIKRSDREGYPMSFLMIDVDFFKSYNDTFGHAEGDKALKIAAHSLKETLRSADIAARYGGEEFSILLPQTTPDEAKIIAERIRRTVEASEFPNRKVTVSIGVASLSHVIATPDTIIKAADNALYEAKRRGRNNVQFYEDLSG